MRNIQVKGTGNISQKPDLIEINMTLRLNNMDYAALMEESAQKLVYLQDDLSQIGFLKEDLKTGNFNVDSRYDSVRNERGEYERKFCGFECTHSLRLELAYDNARLTKTIACLATSKAETEFNIRFTVKDTEALKNALLAAAVADARQKAEILTASAKVVLGEIQNIAYSVAARDFYSESNYQPQPAMLRAKSFAAMDIQPENVKSSDTVTVTWEIK